MGLDFCFSLSSVGLYSPAVASEYITLAIDIPVVENLYYNLIEHSTGEIKILLGSKIETRILSFLFFVAKVCLNSRKKQSKPLSLSIWHYTALYLGISHRLRR